MIKQFFQSIIRWAVQKEIKLLYEELEKCSKAQQLFKQETARAEKILSNFDVSLDVHVNDKRYCRSWAVISLQGEKADFVKFVDLGDNDLREIRHFLSKYEKARGIKIDAAPHIVEGIFGEWKKIKSASI